MHAINSVRDRLRADATVLIIGLGGLGHLALQILAATSAVRVIATDTDPAKLEYAARNGADLVLESGPETAQRVLEATGGHGADVVFDFVGVQQTVEVATRSVRVGGALRFVGIGGGSFTYRAGATRFPWGVNVESAYGGTRQDLREVIALAKRGKIRPEIVRYSLDDAVQAFDDLKAGRVQGRAVFVP